MRVGLRGDRGLAVVHAAHHGHLAAGEVHAADGGIRAVGASELRGIGDQPPECVGLLADERDAVDAKAGGLGFRDALR